MEQSENTNPGFLKDLLNRRVPQLVGFYLAGSWGILQFLDWIVGRYLLSPLLVDLALTVVGALLPSIIVLAYCHGKPGKNQWNKSEKIIIPVNLVLTVILVFSLFNHKNLDSIARRVEVRDESGKKIEKVVPKTNSIKELAIFDLDNLSGDKSLDWLKSGFVNMLELDLSQDPFINIKSPYMNDPFSGFYVYRKFKSAGFDDVSKAPIMLKKKIASELNSSAFLSGKINMKNNLIELKLNVYDTKNSKLLSSKIFLGDNVFSLTDELTVFVKKTLKLPSYKNAEIVDLQIKDIYTDSVQAATLIASAAKEIVLNNNWKDAQKKFEEAIKIDKTFTLAYAGLAEIYAMNNKMDKWKATYKPLMKYLYRLPDKMQFYIKAGYYIAVKGQPEKAISLLKMLIKLYPTDINIYLTLASRLDLSGQYAEAILYYKKILELDPAKFDLYKDIGKAYENDNDQKNAIQYYKIHAEKFPKKPNGWLRIGKVEERSGNFASAATYYEKALLLEPEKISTILLSAGLDIKLGKYKKALKKYLELLNNVNEPRKRASIYSVLSDYYKLKGQSVKELEHTELMLGEREKFTPPLSIMIAKIVTLKVYLKNGKHDLVLKKLESFKKVLAAPFDKLISLGYIEYYLYKKELDKIEKYILDIEEFIKKVGNKQFMFFVSKTRADVFMMKENYTEAISFYKKALAHRHDNTTVLTNIAICFLKEGNFKKSIEFIKTALNISPYDPKICYSASKIYLAQKKNEMGLKLLKRALTVWEDADLSFIPATEAKELYAKYNSGVDNGK